MLKKINLDILKILLYYILYLGILSIAFIDALAKKLGEKLKGADLFAPLPLAEDCPPICLVPASSYINPALY